MSRRLKDFMKMRFLTLSILFMLTVGFISFKVTHAFFSDTATSHDNIFAAAQSFPTSSPTPTPTPPIASHLVINEVYYDPDTAHTVAGTNGDNNSEWIEIYNPTGFSVNVKDWKVTDNSGTERTVSTSNRNIGSGEFAILAKAADVRTLWGVDESKFIALGEIFGNGLANTGDRVILKDNLGNIVDQMSYGTDTTVLNPSAPDVAEGHSLERDPDGLDTNTATDFVNRTTPSPGT